MTPEIIGNSEALTAVLKSVHQLLKQAERRAQHPVGESYDLLYCAGLFDYLSDAVSRKLMEIFFEMLAPGGLLVYSTCSLEAEENEQVTDTVVSELRLQTMRRIPGRDPGDGFYACVIKSEQPAND